MLLEEDTLCHVAAVETKTIDPSNINTADADNSDIINTTRACGDSCSPTPILAPIKPTPDTHIDEELDDYHEYSDYDNDAVE